MVDYLTNAHAQSKRKFSGLNYVSNTSIQNILGLWCQKNSRWTLRTHIADTKIKDRVWIISFQFSQEEFLGFALSLPIWITHQKMNTKSLENMHK